MNHNTNPRLKALLHTLSRLPTFLLSSASATVVDMLGFYLLSLALTPSLGGYSITVCTVIARIVSSLFNFTLNHKMVFTEGKSAKKSDTKRAMLRYYMLAIPQMLCSAGIVSALTFLFGEESALIKTLFKGIADTALFFISYFIQRKWVFKKD
ncbi:MAG: GtrA family protein [Ruminococcaceae bacterium]|nr:GtrA family protein [Oscillospiraceae bacterium]